MAVGGAGHTGIVGATIRCGARCTMGVAQAGYADVVVGGEDVVVFAVGSGSAAAAVVCGGTMTVVVRTTYPKAFIVFAATGPVRFFCCTKVGARTILGRRTIVVGGTFPTIPLGGKRLKTYLVGRTIPIVVAGTYPGAKNRVAAIAA